MSRQIEEDLPRLDVQSEKASDYNYYDHYADDVEDVHLVCSGWYPAQSKRTGALKRQRHLPLNLTASDDLLAHDVE